MGNDEQSAILIVDDVPGNIKMLAEILRGEYKILAATGGATALETVKSQKVDLVLLDAMMPDMDGYEVCRRLKADSETAEIPVIFVTARDEAMDETRGLKLGAVDYVTKPASPPILKARIKNHLEARRQQEELKNLAIVDGLTGVANRRHYDRFLDQEWRRAVRAGLSMAVILIDIDYFKAYNDQLGHQAGDHCLRRVAQELKNTLKRSTDLLARYGGEEFVAVLPQVEHQGGAVTAEKLRRCVADLKIPHPGSQVADHVTVSLGCASMIPTRGSSPQPMLEAADKMLYEAKKSGRNGVRATFL